MRLLVKFTAVVQLLVLVTVMAVSAASALENVQQDDKDRSEVFEGVLIDQKNFLAGKTGVLTVDDLKKSAPGAIFGIALKLNDGSFKFSRFDGNGQTQAADVLKSYPAGEPARITVVGVPVGEIINVVTVNEKLDEKQYEGVLIDRKDFEASKGDPAGVTRENLQATDRIASGYGLAVRQPDGSYSFFKLDDNSQISASEIISATKKERNISVVAQGVWNGSLLQVSSLVEKVD